MVRQWQEFFYERRYAATPMRSPDFVKLAEAHGLAGLRVRETIRHREAVRQARETEGTVVIDFRVEQEDTVYPMVPAGADLHDMIRRPSPIVETAQDPYSGARNTIMQCTFVVYVEDKPGVLNRVASLFRRRTTTSSR